ncbi:MAG: hypothetical protein JW984_06400 [Deltaproteobacteria bacterium]|uniref:Uncharacterized protein n=1 Tax=Candidatus Zymogenus saltonus TaxID=2844893 RepID=A0A9D8KE63_9DELT|nr:hypothetical protein [Candidatus Zymogenus saltonus]
MDKTVNNSDLRPFTDHRMIDLQYQAVEHEISEPYNVEEIKAFLRLESLNPPRMKDIHKNEGSPSPIESSGRMREDTKVQIQIPEPDMNRNGLSIVKGFQTRKGVVSHNGVSEECIQFREALSNPISWIDVFLTIAAGLLIGFILFGAFL